MAEDLFFFFFLLAKTCPAELRGAEPQRNLTAICLPTAIMVLKVLGTLYLVLRTLFLVLCLPAAVGTCYLILDTCYSLKSSRKQLLNHLHWQKHSSTIGELYKSVLFIKLSRFSVYGIHHHGHSTNTYRGQGIGTFQRIQK